MNREETANRSLFEELGEGKRKNVAQFRFGSGSKMSLADVNELRQIMLSELNGIAVSAFSLAVTVDGVTERAAHRYCALGNIMEDMAILIRNLRGIVVDSALFPAKSKLSVEYKFDSSDFGDSNKLGITCAMLFAKDTSVRFVNGGHRIVTLVRETEEQKVVLSLTLVFEDGAGFVETADEKIRRTHVGVIPVSAQHSPVIRCAFHEGEEGYIDVEIETNGSLEPKDALENALALFQEKKEKRKRESDEDDLLI